MSETDPALAAFIAAMQAIARTAQQWLAINGPTAQAIASTAYERPQPAPLDQRETA